MNHSGRYDVSGFIEGQYEPGSRGRVLRNLMRIKRKREMDAMEGKELVDFGRLRGKKKGEYFIAVQSGLDRNYAPMEKIFDEALERTLSLHEQTFRSAF